MELVFGPDELFCGAGLTAGGADGDIPGAGEAFLYLTEPVLQLEELLILLELVLGLEQLFCIWLRYEVCSESNASGETTTKRISLADHLFRVIFRHNLRRSGRTFCSAPSTGEKRRRSLLSGWFGRPPPSSSARSPASERGQPARSSLLGRGRNPPGRDPAIRADGEVS